MDTSLDLTGTRYDWLLTVFYIAYVAFEWFPLMWKVIPAHIWASCTVFAWSALSTCVKGRAYFNVQSYRGSVAALQAATTTFKGEAVCRFLLGMAEAGFSPGVPYFLSFFYLRNELGFRIGMYIAAAPLANSFAGALAYVSSLSRGVKPDDVHRSFR